MAAAAILKIRKIAIRWHRFQLFRLNLAWWRSSTLLTVRTVPILIFKKSRWRRPPSWKIPKSRYIGNGLTDRHEIWHGYAYWPSEQVRHLKFSTFTNQIRQTAALLKIQKWPYLGNGLTDRHNNWHDDAHWLSEPGPAVEISTLKKLI